MDCGVSSSSGHNQLDGKRRLPVVSSSAAGGTKIECDEDITDLNAVASSSSSMATTESSEAMMEEVLKTSRALEERSESELLDSSSSAVSNSHRLSTGSISSASNDNNSESSSSLCPLAFGSGTTNGAGAFLSNNIEIAET